MMLEQPVVADEVDVVEVDLRLDLRRHRRVVGQAATGSRCSARRPASAPATAVPTPAARLLVVPRRAPTSPASSLGAAVTSTLNTSVTSAPWPMPNDDQPEHDGGGAPVVADDPGQPQQRHGADDEADTGRSAAASAVSYSRTTSMAVKNTVEVERQHRDRRLDRRATLDDLDVERDGKLSIASSAHDAEHAEDGRPLLPRRRSPAGRAAASCPPPAGGGSRR